MMAGSDYIDLEYDVKKIKGDDRLVLIKKQKFMNGDYTSYLLKCLSDTPAADEIFFNKSIKLRDSETGEEGRFIAIILRGPIVKDYYIGYLLSSITSQFYRDQYTEEDEFLLDEEVTKIADEIKKKPMKKNPKKLDLGLLFGESLLPEGLLPGSDFLHEESAPDYIKDYPVCPNVTINMMQDMYMEYYQVLLKLKVLSKTDNSYVSMESVEDKIRQVKQILLVIEEEMDKIVPFQRNCYLCEEQCDADTDK